MAWPMDILDPFTTLSLQDAGLACAIGYLLGSIPFGLVITKLAGLGDLRDIGSGNIGATNALRTGNKLVALLTLIGDAGKGALAVLVVRKFLGGDTALVAGVAAFLGHLYSVWISFKGGKGVATYLGLVAALSSTLGLVAVLIWIHTLLIFRFSSLSALNTALLTPIIAASIGLENFVLPTAVMSALIFWRHRANIKRLISGDEPKVWQKKPKSQDT